MLFLVDVQRRAKLQPPTPTPCSIPLLTLPGTVPGMGFHADAHLGPGQCTSRPDALMCRCHSPHFFPAPLDLTPRGPALLPDLTCLSTGLGLSNGRCH